MFTRRAAVIPVFFLLFIFVWSLAPGQTAQIQYPRPIAVAGKWGYVNAGGQTVIEPKYAQAKDFSEGLAVVETIDPPGHQQLINDKGIVVVDGPRASIEFGPMSEGLYYFHYIGNNLEYPCGFADRTATVKIRLHLEDCSRDLVRFSEGMAVIGKLNSRFRLIDHTGRSVVAGRFDDAAESVDGFARITENRYENRTVTIRFGYVSASSHKLVIDAALTAACDFGEGLAAAAQVNEGVKREGFIDATGKFVLISDENSTWKPVLEASGWHVGYCSRFASGVAPVESSDGQTSYIDRTGKQAFDRTFTDGTPFNEDRAIVKIVVVDSMPPVVETQVIDNTGKTVTSLGTDANAEPFLYGLSKVEISHDLAGNVKEWGYVNKDGKIVWDSH